MNKIDDIKLFLKQHAITVIDASLHVWSRLARPWINRRFKKWAQTRTPSAIQMATVNFCNAKCVFCGQHRFRRPKGVMSMETFRMALREARAIGVRWIDFTPTLGDPLLDPKLEERARRCRAVGMKVTMTTNGILFGNKAWILDCFDLVRVSIGGMDRESYRRAYAVDKFDEVYNGLVWMLEANEARPDRTQFHLMFRSEQKPSEILAQPGFRAIRHHSSLSWEFTSQYDNWGGSVKPSDLIGEMRPRSPKKKTGVPCQALEWTFIEHSGNVRLCGCRFLDRENDDLVVGNVNQTMLKKLVSGRAVTDIGDMFIKGPLPDVCVSCTLYRPRM